MSSNQKISEEIKKEETLSDLNQYDLSDLSILVVNDEPMTLMIIKKMLTTKLDIREDQLAQARDGREACEIALTQDFDLIIMDLNMPFMSGFEATMRIRKQVKNDTEPKASSAIDKLLGYEPSLMVRERQDPYIVALSASIIDKDLKKRCQEAGFDDQFSAPLTITDFIKQILPKVHEKREAHLQRMMQSNLAKTIKPKILTTQ